MCIVCAMWEKGKLNRQEVNQALNELVFTGATEEEHALELLERVADDEDKWEEI